MGRQMAEQRKRAAASTAKKKAVRKPAGTKTGSNKAAARTKTKAGSEQSEAGFEQLLSAVQNELSQRGELIARKLRQKSEAGDTQSTKLLIALATKPSQKLVAKAESVALKIASDPEWKPEGRQETQAEAAGKMDDADK